MNSRSIFSLLVLLSVHSTLTAQSLQTKPSAHSRTYDLPSMAQHGQLLAENRIVTPLPAEKAIRFSAAPDDGVTWLQGVEFANGTIELDIRGKNVLQQSFVGIAFHGFTKDSLEVIYFRPFNFQAPDTPRSVHMVQYVSPPSFPWERLRSERTGVFEKRIPHAPQPDNWFHARIVVHYPKIEVYVNHESVPSLVVTELSQRRIGKIGLWAGNMSDGDFANLVITDD
jgi:hypothetical protein